MQPITLSPGKVVSMSVSSGTLTVINDPFLAPVYSQEASTAGMADMIAGTVLVGFASPAFDPSTADAIIPPFMTATVPIPDGIEMVYFLYLGGAAQLAHLDNGAMVPMPLVIYVSWVNVFGPATLAPTARILPPAPSGLISGGAIPIAMATDYFQHIIPPSPATTVYDQGLASANYPPHFRPHLAPSLPATAHLTPAAINTTYALGMQLQGGPAQLTLTVLKRLYVCVSAGCLFVAGGAGLTVGSPGVQEIIRFNFVAAGSQVFEFDEGLEQNPFASWAWKYYVSALAVLDCTAILG